MNCTDGDIFAAGLYDSNDELLAPWAITGLSVDDKSNPIIQGNVVVETPDSSSYIMTKYPRATKIVFPDNITRIGNYSFAGCRNITASTLHRSLTSIGTGAFALCDSLTDIYYDGTLAQWNENIGARVHEWEYTLHCTDGDTYFEAQE